MAFVQPSYGAGNEHQVLLITQTLHFPSGKECRRRSTVRTASSTSRRIRINQESLPRRHAVHLCTWFDLLLNAHISCG